MKKILFITLVGILIVSNAYALNISRVKTWSASDVLTASDLNAEFDNIVNHSIVNADISSSAAIVASKLDLTIGTPIGSTTASTGAFSTLSATTAIPVTSGGMGAATFTDGGILIGNGTGAIVVTAVLADGEILVGDGTTDPVAESGATLRTSIGCQASDAQLDDLADGTLSGASTVSTGALTGTVAVANGGTNQTTTGLAFGSKIVTWTGDGVDNRDIAHGLGRTPIFIIITDTSLVSRDSVIWMTGMPATYAKPFSSGAINQNYIVSVDATNVRIRNSNEINGNTETYSMFVM